MSLAKYQAFLATAEHQNLTKAAAVLGYTQSGISHLLAGLEEDLGVTLFVRGRQGAQLTPEGQHLLPHIQRILHAEQDLHAAADDLKKVLAGSLRIGTISSIAMSYLPRILQSFQAKHPGLELTVINGSYADLEAALMENRVDCAFVTLPSLKEFSITPLLRDRLMAILPKNSPRTSHVQISLKELRDEMFILPAEGSHYDIGKLFSAAGITPQSRFVIHDDFAALAMVRQGLGYTILPELLFDCLPQEGICAIPLRSSEREIGIAVNRNRYQSPAIRAFVSSTSEAFGA